MIILDTNVVSEPLRRLGNPLVINWLDLQSAGTLFLTATSLSELLLGIAIPPHGRRRDELELSLSKLLPRLFADRILPFDKEAARAYAQLSSRARTAGRPISIADAQIAAIAQVHQFAVATRDSLPFQTAGIPIIDPWQVNDEQ